MPARRPRATLLDVARVAKVSPRTVSRVINGERYVADETVARIQQAVEELQYRPNELARQLKSGERASTIGMIIEDLGNPFYSTVARAVERVAAAHGSILVVASSEEDPAEERRLVRELCQRHVDGLLMVPAAGDHSYLKVEIAAGTPVVLLDRPDAKLKVDTVLIANVDGAHAAVRDQIARGHRRIAVLADDVGIWTVEQRLAGYRKALQEAGIGVEDELVRIGARTPAETAAQVSELLQLDDPPTAVFCVNNRHTIGALLQLTELGVQLGVAGFDDFESAALAPFPITLVAHDPALMGRRAAEMLFRRIDGSTARARSVVLPTTMISRGLARKPDRAVAAS